MNTESQCKRLLEHLLKGNGVTFLYAFKTFGISSLHRRLFELRTGLYDGISWPIDFGTWSEHGGKRFKIYNMDIDKVTEMIFKPSKAIV